MCGAQDFANALTNTPNEEVSGPSQVAGLLTTPFKNIGVQGWTDFYRQACVSGVVTQAALSTDRFATIDVAVTRFSVCDVETSVDSNRFLRIELCTVCRTDSLPQVGQSIRVCGELMWDWDPDGFLEIHPRTNDVLAVDQASTRSSP